jgi:DNA-binding transcriptional ArsR family regulator
MDTKIILSRNDGDKTHFFAALGDPVRFAIVQAIRDRERRVGEIAALFPISRPAISKHIRILKAAGVLSERQSGRNRFLRLAPEALAATAEWLLDLARADWSRRADSAAAKTRAADWAPYL